MWTTVSNGALFIIRLGKHWTTSSIFPICTYLATDAFVYLSTLEYDVVDQFSSKSNFHFFFTSHLHLQYHIDLPLYRLFTLTTHHIKGSINWVLWNIILSLCLRCFLSLTCTFSRHSVLNVYKCPRSSPYFWATLKGS